LLALAIIGLHVLTAQQSFLGDHRLAPLFMLRDGLTVYPNNPTSGPMLSTIYPPLSTVLYAPSLLFRNIRPALMTAGLIVELLVLVPALLLLSQSGAEARVSLTMAVAFVFLCDFNTVLATAHWVHCDAPALFFCGVAVACASKYFSTNAGKWLVLSALFASLAPWAKQTSFLIVLAPAMPLLLLKRWRSLGAYMATALLVQAVLIPTACRIFGFANLKLWLFDIPRHHPWVSVWSTALPNSNRALLECTAPALAVLCLIHEAKCLEGLAHPALGIVPGRWTCAVAHLGSCSCEGCQRRKHIPVFDVFYLPRTACACG
jgi:hypothetical protein